jgi:hypothetical protein
MAGSGSILAIEFIGARITDACGLTAWAGTHCRKATEFGPQNRYKWNLLGVSVQGVL